MASLFGRRPAETYPELLKLTRNGQGLDATLRGVETGDGVMAPLQLSTTQIALNGIVWPNTGAVEGKILMLGAGSQLGWADLPEVTSDSVIAALGYTPVSTATRNQANGYAGLDANGLISSSHLNNLIVTTGLGFTPENVAKKNQANGYVGLDANGKISNSQLNAPVAAGANNEIQFNSNGTLGASSKFVWDNSGNRMSIGTYGVTNYINVPNAGSLVVGGGSLNVAAGDGGPGTTSGHNGGSLMLLAGRGGSNSTGPGSPGGNIQIAAGQAGSSNTGVASAGYVTIEGGTNGGDATGGYIALKTNNVQRLRILQSGAWSVGTTATAYGTAGQALISNGDAAPTWQSISASSLSGTSLAATVVNSSLTTVGTLSSLAVTSTFSPYVFGSWSSSNLGGTGASVSGYDATTGRNSSNKIYSTTSKNAGKWYWEVKVLSGDSSNPSVGIIRSSKLTSAAFNGDSTVGYGYQTTVGSTIGVALDFASLTIKFYKDGAQVSSLPITADTYHAAVGTQSAGNAVFHANFGQEAFVYSVPSGFTPAFPASGGATGGIQGIVVTADQPAITSVGTLNNLTLAADPTTAMGAATKQYVDNKVATAGDFKADGSVPMTGTLDVPSLQFNDHVTNSANSFTTSVVGAYDFVTLPANEVNGIKILTTIIRGNDIQMMETLIAHDGTQVYTSQYGVVLTDLELGTLDVRLENSNVIISFNNNEATATTIKYFYTQM